MYYEINVSQNGKHLFATSERSCTNQHETLKVYGELAKRFPEDEGFEITIREIIVRGTKISIGDL